MKPSPKVAISLESLFNILFSMAQLIKKLRAQIAELEKDSARKDKQIELMSRGIIGAYKAIYGEKE